jgi:hypothetical protein
MRFDYRSRSSLPRLAWCARIRRGAGDIVVDHGPWVETGANRFVEGAWDGPFDASLASSAIACFGSGGELAENGVRFVTPTHMLERLHLIRRGEEIVISNSLVFALVVAGEEIDPAYKYYHFDLMTNMRGYRRYRPSVRTKSGGEVRVFMHCNVFIDQALTIRVEDKSLPPEFTNYDHYIGYLRDTVRAVNDNAEHTARCRRYPPIATISSGYDSPAVALLASEVGCREAITFGRARPGYDEEDDSGAEIAAALGLRVLEFDRLTYQTLDSFPEAEFLACGAGGEEVVFAPLADVLGGRTLYTGYLGDAVWNRVSRRVNTELLMLYPGGSSLTEFRLRSGFIHFPVPTLGYIRHPSIYAISNSETLRPWVLGTDYDRPIPRRLLEEAGVPRTAFGRTKKAITQPLWNTDALDRVFTPRSYEDFRRYVQRFPIFEGGIDRLTFRALRAAYEVNLRVNWRLQALGKPLGIHVDERPLVSERYSQELGPSALTFHWGVNRLRSRYAETGG